MKTCITYHLEGGGAARTLQIKRLSPQWLKVILYRRVSQPWLTLDICHWLLLSCGICPEHYRTSSSIPASPHEMPVGPLFPVENQRCLQISLPQDPWGAKSALVQNGSKSVTLGKGAQQTTLPNRSAGSTALLCECVCAHVCTRTVF